MIQNCIRILLLIKGTLEVTLRRPATFLSGRNEEPKNKNAVRIKKKILKIVQIYYNV